MARLRVSRRASADLLDIWLFIAQDSQEAADRHLSVLHEKFRTLSLQPGIGRRRDELRAGMRSFPAGKHIIYYRESRDGILILRVLHGARDVGPMFG